MRIIRGARPIYTCRVCYPIARIAMRDMDGSMTILRLNHIADTRLEVYVELTNHQLRNALDPQRGLAIVESEIAIRTAIANGAKPQSFLLDERKLEAMEDLLTTVSDDVPVFVLPPDEAQKLTGYRVTRGALCAVRRPVLPSMEELLAEARRLVLLEGITDTSNVGAIFRNAAALGADAVLVAPTCADPLSRRAIRVSMGNVFGIPWCRTEGRWPINAMDMLRDAGFRRIALALDEKAVSLEDVCPSGDRMALLFGTEGSGLTANTLALCDQTVIIPMAHGVDSLNVAASSAVAMWELFARRR